MLVLAQKIKIMLASFFFAKFGTIAAVIVLISLLTKKQVNGKYQQMYPNITFIQI